ncbi:MAG: hypothetical protein ACPGTS_02080 [Minisyncoccia bacterium]
MTKQKIETHKKDIESLSQSQMAHLIRFAPIGHPYFNMAYSDIYKTFEARFNKLGGMSPEISKSIGWD